jgi:hypothetical protein
MWEAYVYINMGSANARMCISKLVFLRALCIFYMSQVEEAFRNSGWQEKNRESRLSDSLYPNE